jgi:hypothetical protein
MFKPLLTANNMLLSFTGFSLLTMQKLKSHIQMAIRTKRLIHISVKNELKETMYADGIIIDINSCLHEQSAEKDATTVTEI